MLEVLRLNLLPVQGHAGCSSPVYSIMLFYVIDNCYGNVEGPGPAHHVAAKQTAAVSLTLDGGQKDMGTTTSMSCWAAEATFMLILRQPC